MTLPAMENSKEVFETTLSTPEATIMEEYMQDLNKILSTDVTKLYNEKPCIDSGSVSSFDVDTWINELPQKLLIHIRQLCNLDESCR